VVPPSRASLPPLPAGPHSLRLLLVRHGETVWNREGRYQGVIDVPLSPAGERQAAALAVQLRSEPIAAVYSSTLRRAYHTAVPIAAAHGLTVIRDPRLNEINQGQWEGLRPAEIVQRWPELHARWQQEPLAVRLPGGETLEEVRARVLAALDDIVLAWAGRTVCIVAHQGSLAVIRSQALGLTLAEALRAALPNASVEAVVLYAPPSALARRARR
jgi:broad specificity phosphatase PhoE